MSRHKIQCPTCYAELNVEDRLIGKSVPCPGCKTQFTVKLPAKSATVPSDPVPIEEWDETYSLDDPDDDIDDSAAASPPPPRRRPKKQRRNDSKREDDYPAPAVQIGEAIVRGGWVVTGLYAAWTALEFSAMLADNSETPAVALGAVGAVFATRLIACYVLMRCFEEVVIPRTHR